MPYQLHLGLTKEVLATVKEISNIVSYIRYNLYISNQCIGYVIALCGEADTYQYGMEGRYCLVEKNQYFNPFNGMYIFWDSSKFHTLTYFPQWPLAYFNFLNLYLAKF